MRARLSRFSLEISAAIRHLFAPKVPSLPETRRPLPVVVVAYSFEEAREYARRQGLGGDWRYPVQADQLYGYRECDLRLVGRWAANKGREFIEAVGRIEAFNARAGRVEQ